MICGAERGLRDCLVSGEKNQESLRPLKITQLFCGKARTKTQMVCLLIQGYFPCT